MRVGLARPDRFLAPVRRGLRRRRVRLARRLGVAYDELDLRRGVRSRIDDRHVISAGLKRAVDRAVGIHRRIALVARDLVMQIRLRIGPIPHRHHDVAFAALRP